jgi:DNA-binding SARP family transcriptional activator
MLEVVLLGEFRVRSDGRLLPGLQPPRTQALIGYLALHRGTPQPRQRIAGLFWPDSTEAQARTNLRRELHQVRRCLPDPEAVFAADQISVWWQDDAPAEIDVTAFEAAASRAWAALRAGDQDAFVENSSSAVAVYGGDLLPGLYDNWVLDERERLRRECVDLLDQLIQAKGDDAPASIVAYARRRVELQPLEEVGYRTLIDILTRMGDRAAALQTFYRCASVLERELEVAPSQETVHLYERLFASSEGALPGQARSLSHAAAVFVGRERELARLETIWSEAASGSARMVLVSGEAGIGKSRLAEELLANVRRLGGAVARARCFAGERPLPLGPVSDWLHSDVCRSAIGRLDPPWRIEVARLAPELGPNPDRGARDSNLPGDSWQRHRFFEGLVRAVLAVERPMALLLDDLQWCDLDTLTWLDLCIHLGADAPLLVVATARPEEVYDNADVAAVLSRLRAAGAVVDVEIGPLSEGETAQLAARLLGVDMETASVSRLQSVTAGVPLFVVEALRSQKANADLRILESPRVQAVLAGRLSRLSSTAGRLASVASAVGRDFSLDLLAEASGLELDRAVDALDELWRRRIVREHSAGTYDFTHDLLRAAAYDGLSPPRRVRAHWRVAQALAAVNGGDAAAAQIADQYDRAGMPEQAVPFYREAVLVAVGTYAYREAVRLAEHALGLLAGLPPGRERDNHELELRIAAAGPRNALGGWTSVEAQRNTVKIRDLAERTGDLPAHVEALAVLWGTAFVEGRLPEGAALAEQAHAISADIAELAPYGHLAIAGSLTSAGDPKRALGHFDLATSERDPGGPGLLGFAPSVMAWAWSAHACWLTGRVEEARTRAITAVRVAEERAKPFGRAVAVAYSAITHQLRGERDETLRRAREIQRLCAEHHFTYYQHWGEVLEGWYRGGQDGAAMIADGIRRLREHGVGSRLPYYLALQAETLIDAGRPEEAAAVVAEARIAAEEHVDRWWLPEVSRLEGRLMPGPDGDDHLHRALVCAINQDSTSLALRAAAELAVRFSERGDHNRARELAGPLRASCSGTSPEIEAIDARLASFLVR